MDLETYCYQLDELARLPDGSYPPFIEKITDKAISEIIAGHKMSRPVEDTLRKIWGLGC